MIPIIKIYSKNLSTEMISEVPRVIPGRTEILRPESEPSLEKSEVPTAKSEVLSFADRDSST